MLAVGLAIAVGILTASSPVQASTDWLARLFTGSTGEASAGAAPGTPGGVGAACVSAKGTSIEVSWNAVSHATSYAVLESSGKSGSYTVVATVTTTAWTSTFANGSYRFEVESYAGAEWASAASGPTTKLTISNGKKCK